MADAPIVLATRKLPPAVEKRLCRDYNATLNSDDSLYQADAMLRAAEGADALFILPSERLDADIIKALPASVRAVATFSVGYEHIDLAAAKDRGLIVTNTPDVLTAATADLAMLLILTAARRAFEAQDILRAGKWPRVATTWMLGSDVAGKRLGIFGMGRIGQTLAKRARGFDMTIHYHNRHRLPADQEAGAIYHEDPEEMLPQCDFLSMNCPANKETHHWLNEARIALLPDGAYVINTSRGPVIDEAALVAALASGKLRGAGLDVYEHEPKIHPGLIEQKNAFLLPHIGSATIETRDAMGFKCLDNLDAIFAGKEPPDRIA
ncbi:MAG: 2-hydroxyacid dehydrogenase [Alphaproteobacteria bacterium]